MTDGGVRPTASSASARDVAVAALLATLVHALLVSRFHLTFLADDYNLLAAARVPGGLPIASFGAYWSRVPVWSLVTWPVFASGVWEHTWLPMHAFFACHATALAILLRWWLARTCVAFSTVTFAAIVTVMTLHPNAYEVLYWPTDMAYTVGALLLALGVATRRTIPATVVLVLSFLTLETFVLPALAFAVLDGFHRWLTPAATADAALAVERRSKPSGIAEVVRSTPGLRSWTVAIVLYAAIRIVLGRIVPYPYHVELAAGSILRHAMNAVGALLLIHFRKLEAVPSLLQWIALGAAAFMLVRRGSVRGPVLLLAAAVCCASTAASWVLAYNAPRSLYGSGLLFATLVGWIVAALFRAPRATGFARISLAVLAAAYIGQELRVFSIKHHNANVLAARDVDLARQMVACAEPCTLSVEALDRGLKRDWLLPRPYWDPYLRWTRLRFAPGKTIVFRLPPR